MALEAVIYQQDPFIYGYKDFNYNIGIGLDLLLQEENPNVDINGGVCSSTQYWDSPPSSAAQNSTSSGDGGGAFLPAAGSRRKRRRNKTLKNKEEMENQRMTHIAVERNRRRQMNDYLGVLRSLMPPSYAQRGDQASIVGGAINFVKELEHLVQFLEAQKLSDGEEQKSTKPDIIFSDFFTFPQYSMRPSSTVDATAERRSSIANIEVTMVESHANIKILTNKRQLLKMVAGFQSLCLSILHLNITTVDHSVLYSVSVKVEDECQLSTVSDIATAVHEMLIQEESTSSSGRDNPPHQLN